jgi:hypothetical protein
MMTRSMGGANRRSLINEWPKMNKTHDNNYRGMSNRHYGNSNNLAVQSSLVAGAFVALTMLIIMFV